MFVPSVLSSNKVRPIRHPRRVKHCIKSVLQMMMGPIVAAY